MKFSNLLLAVSLSVFLFSSTQALAQQPPALERPTAQLLNRAQDIVRLKSGTIVTGIIIAEDDVKVQLFRVVDRTLSTNMYLHKDQILRISRGDDQAKAKVLPYLLKLAAAQKAERSVRANVSAQQQARIQAALRERQRQQTIDKRIAVLNSIGHGTLAAAVLQHAGQPTRVGSKSGGRGKLTEHWYYEFPDKNVAYHLHLEKSLAHPYLGLPAPGNERIPGFQMREWGVAPTPNAPWVVVSIESYRLER